MIKEFPAESQGSRFGNPAFRLWIDAVCSKVPVAHHEALALPGEVSDEIASYLQNSFGDRQRLDYGTGHELHFLAWLYCLFAPSSGPYLSKSDCSTAILLLFPAYLKITRSVQRYYTLEPAGSHGVWGLDDHHFLPFLFGAAQLSLSHELTPRAVHDPDLLSLYAPNYLYLSAIQAIYDAKTGASSLRVLAPMLDDISAVRSWTKIYQGLTKMYRVEVLGKVPIMQHFLFGSIIPFTSNSSGERNLTEIKVHRGDCCGNPLPSRYASSSKDQNCLHKATNQMPFD